MYFRLWLLAPALCSDQRAQPLRCPAVFSLKDQIYPVEPETGGTAKGWLALSP